MKFVFHIILAFLFSSCSITPLKHIKSTSQKWNIVEKNISGTNYHIVLKTFRDTNIIKIDSLCINNKIITNFNLSVIGKSNTCKNYIMGDSILISVNIMDNINNKFNYCICNKNSNLSVYYSNKNKQHSIFIKSIQTLPTL